VLTRRADPLQNLDSLLDTMANVVGILVVVMAVTQIHVGDAMKRIRLYASEESAALGQRAAELEERWSRIQAEDAGVHAEASRLEAALHQLRALPAPDAGQEAELERRIRRLEREIAERRESLEALQVRLAGMRELPAAFPSQVRLPDPRPAPPGARRVVFFCRRGRVIQVELSALEERASATFRELARQGLGPREIVSHFALHDVGNAWLRWRPFVRGDQLFAQLEWRRQRVGESRRELERDDSAYRRELAALAPARHYLVYYVWSDSFAEYLAARSLAEAQGFAAGWTPLEASGDLEYVVGRSRSEDPIPVD
jgi:hypothetical protein